MEEINLLISQIEADREQAEQKRIDNRILRSNRHKREISKRESIVRFIINVIMVDLICVSFIYSSLDLVLLLSLLLLCNLMGDGVD